MFGKPLTLYEAGGFFVSGDETVVPVQYGRALR